MIISSVPLTPPLRQLTAKAPLQHELKFMRLVRRTRHCPFFAETRNACLSLRCPPSGALLALPALPTLGPTRPRAAAAPTEPKRWHAALIGQCCIISLLLPQMAQRDRALQRHQAAQGTQWLGPLASVVTDQVRPKRPPPFLALPAAVRPKTDAFACGAAVCL